MQASATKIAATTFLIAISILIGGVFSQTWASEFFTYCDSEPGFVAGESFLGNILAVDEVVDRAVSKSEKDEPSPFPNSCRHPGALKNRPKTGMFQREIPEVDGSGRKAADFLKRVGRRVLDSMAGEELKISIYAECFSKTRSASDAGCMASDDWLKNELRPLVKKSRMNLALAQTTGQSKTLRGATDDELNLNLSNLGTQKHAGWSPLSPTEINTAKRILAEYKTETAQAAEEQIAQKKLSPSKRKNFENDAILSSRYTNGLLYVEDLSRFPVLQYLSSEIPLENELAEALTRMLSHLKSDQEVAKKAVAAIHAPIKVRRGSVTMGVAPDSLDLLSFTTHVEAELLKNPEDCGLAAALLKVKDSRSRGNQLAVGVPLVAVSLGLPVVGFVAAGVGVGFASGAGFALKSYFDMTEARNRFVSKIEAQNLSEYEDLKAKDKVFMISLALAPTAVLVAPAARAIAVGAQAASFGTKLARTAPKK